MFLGIHFGVLERLLVNLDGNSCIHLFYFRIKTIEIVEKFLFQTCRISSNTNSLILLWLLENPVARF